MIDALKTSPSGKALAWLGGGYSEFKTLVITLTREELESVPNCPGLGSTFELLHPDGYERDWTIHEQLRFIHSPMGRWFGVLVKYQILPAWDMSRRDLSSYDFRLKDLSGCSLRESKLPLDMRACDLRRCDLFGIEAVGSDFCGANLSGSILDSADLRGASFVESALHGVEMNRCRLNGSYWRESVLKHCRMNGANLTGSTWVDCLLDDVESDEVVNNEPPEAFIKSVYAYDEDGQPHPVFIEDEA